MNTDARVQSHGERPAHAADDTELVRRAQADPRAFQAVYEVYLPQVYRFVATRARSVAEAEDMTSATFEKALRMLGSYQHRGPFEAWLLRIALNCVRHQARQDRSLRQEPLAWADGVAAGDDTEREALSNLVDEEVRTRLGHLPSGQCEALTLMIMADLRPSQIARVIGKREGAVRVLLHRALRALKEVSPHG